MKPFSNLLLRGDALPALEKLWQLRGQTASLIYVDPPFNVGTSFTARTASDQVRARGTRASSPTAYNDSWGGLDGFIAFLEPRIAAMRQVMSPQALLWLHLDYRAIHDAKIACDRVFGRGAFRGEVIWVPGNGSRARTGPGNSHQTLLIYSASPDPKAEFVWNGDDPELRESYAGTSLGMHFKRVDIAGRHYRDRTIGGKTYRYYADQGRRLGSVWTDIPAMHANTPIRKEGTGYPTQKPEKLLERIIKLCSHPGDVVCDPMCGSGTTLAVADRLNRKFAGIDVGELAVKISAARLLAQGAVFETAL